MDLQSLYLSAREPPNRPTGQRSGAGSVCGSVSSTVSTKTVKQPQPCKGSAASSKSKPAKGSATTAKSKSGKTSAATDRSRSSKGSTAADKSRPGRNPTAPTKSKPAKNLTKGKSRSGTSSRSRSVGSSVSRHSMSESMPGSKSHYSHKATEIFEAFKMLPRSLQKIERQRQLGMWKTPRSSEKSPKSKKDVKKRFRPDLDDEPPRFYNSEASDEPQDVGFFESHRIELGKTGRVIPRIDLRNPVIIDPLATTIPPQPQKFILAREIADLYHKFTREEQARDAYSRGSKVPSQMQLMFEMEELDKARPPAPKPLGPTDPIPFTSSSGSDALSLAINPQPYFGFLDLITAVAPERLVPSSITRPYDWIPQRVRKLSSHKTLPAIFWSNSKSEAVSVVFYIFPTRQNIQFPVSIGTVDDQTVPNIPVDSIKFMSQSLIRVYWSGYIDFSRPMIVPNSVIYNTASTAKANEREFWELWKCLFKRSCFGGHQYGLTPETRDFENPVRLRRSFEGKKYGNEEYTAQVALERRPFRHVPDIILRGYMSDSDDDDTIIGCDVDSEAAGGDDGSLTVAENRNTQHKLVSPNDPSDDCMSDSGSTTSVESIENQPPVANWLDAIFQHPPTITLDPNVKITVTKRLAMEMNTRPVQKPLKEVKTKEDGINVGWGEGELFDDPGEYFTEEYLNRNVPAHNRVSQGGDLNGFDKRILKLMNQVIGPGGGVHEVSSAHTAYRYEYPGVNDTKSLLRQYRKECIEREQKADIARQGYTELRSGPYMWDEGVHERRMVDEVVTKDARKIFYKIFGEPPYRDKAIRRSYKIINDAKKSGRGKIPVAWVPKEVMEILDKTRIPSIQTGFSMEDEIISASSSEEEAERTAGGETADEQPLQKQTAEQPRTRTEGSVSGAKPQSSNDNNSPGAQSKPEVLVEDRQPDATALPAKRKGGPPPLPPRPPHVMEMIYRKNLPDAETHNRKEAKFKKSHLYKTPKQRDIEHEKRERKQDAKEKLKSSSDYDMNSFGNMGRNSSKSLSGAELKQSSCEDVDSKSSDSVEESPFGWAIRMEDADASWLIARADESLYGKRKLAGKFNAVEAQTFLEQKGVGANISAGFELLQTPSSTNDTPHDNDASSLLTESTCVQRWRSKNSKEDDEIDFETLTSDNGWIFTELDEIEGPEIEWLELLAINDSIFEDKYVPPLDLTTHDKQALTETPTIDEFSTKDGSVSSSSGEETDENDGLSAAKNMKSRFFIECNAENDEDSAPATKEEDICQYSQFVSTGGQSSSKEDKSEYGQDDLTDSPDPQNSTTNLKSRFFIECNAGDDGDPEPVAKEDDQSSQSSCDDGRPSLTMNHGSDHHSGLSTGTNPKSIFFIECNANDDNDDGDPNLATKEDLKLSRSPFTTNRLSLDKQAEDNEDDLKLLTGKKPRATNRKSLFFIECNANDEDEDLVDKEDQLSGSAKESRGSSNHKDDSDSSGRASLLSSVKTVPRAITREELRAIRKSRLGESAPILDKNVNVSCTSDPASKLQSSQQQRQQTELNTPSEVKNLYLKKPGKVRIPDAFRGDQTSTPQVSIETSRLLKHSSIVKKTTGESEWSYQMREDGLRRRFESSRRRHPGNPF